MSKILMPSRWGMKVVDMLLIFLLFAVLMKLLAPTSGLAAGIHVFSHWLSVGVQWIGGLLAQFLDWI